MLKKGLITELQLACKFFHNSVSCLTEEDSNYTPKEEIYTVAQQVLHTAMVVEWFMEGAFTSESGFNLNFEQFEKDVRAASSLTQALERLDKATEEAVKIIEGVSEEELYTPLPEGPIMAGIPKLAVVSSISDHSAHHRGALTVYARLLGKTPKMPYGDLEG